MSSEYGMFTLNRSRADTLKIKAQLHELLSPEDGQAYWGAFGELLSGKITRDEFSAIIDSILIGEAARLHNQLILAILYNTTKASVAPPATSRHAGWNKRKRDGQDEASQLALSLDPREAKKRRIKEMVYALGKRERRRIKNIAQLGQSVHQGQPLQRSFGLIDGVSAHATIANQGLKTELKRCQAAQICSETLSLPSTEVLRDRMSCGAFTASLSGGVEPASAVLLGSALEMHLKHVIGKLLGVMRSENRMKSEPLEAKSEAGEDEEIARLSLPASNRITMLDMATLFELDPQLFVSTHIGALETHLSAHDWSMPRSDSEDELPEQEAPKKVKKLVKGAPETADGQKAEESAEKDFKLKSPPKKLSNGDRAPLGASQPISQKGAPTFKPSASGKEVTA